MRILIKFYFYTSLDIWLVWFIPFLSRIKQNLKSLCIKYDLFRTKTDFVNKAYTYSTLIRE